MHKNTQTRNNEIELRSQVLLSCFSPQTADSDTGGLDFGGLATDLGVGAGLGGVGLENRVDMLEIPGKGRCYVFLSR